MWRQWLILIIVCKLFAGCGPKPVPGGTEGVVHVGATTLPDILVRVFPADSADAVGFGITESDGAFELRKPNATGPLWLPPGEYRATIESVGPTRLVFPADYARPETTPLMVIWTGDDRVLDLEVPEPTVGR